MVLRHQLAVFERKAGRPKLRRLDRMFLAAFARLVPRERPGGRMARVPRATQPVAALPCGVVLVAEVVCDDHTDIERGSRAGGG